jgi:predicted oxidoreductase
LKCLCYNEKNTKKEIGVMYNISFGKSGIEVPTVAVGCMRISDKTEKEVSEFVETALSCGANFFDHADIYGGGKSEEVFGKAIASLDRENLIIQTKCGIRKAFSISLTTIL